MCCHALLGPTHGAAIRGPLHHIVFTGLHLAPSQRYDFLSAGMGAMVVTSFCFARGQDVTTALWISAAATVGAVVLNELLFSQDN